MKKLLLTIILFLPFVLNAQMVTVDEKINDIYFANGILKKAEH